MIYGLIFLEHTRLTAQDQRSGILRFAKKFHMVIDKFISFNNNPDILMFNSGDTIICYAWNCLCKEMSFMRMFIQHIIKNNIYLYSATSKYHIAPSMDINTLQYAFSMYEDIRGNFWSRKAIEGASKRIIPGRRTGSKNKNHVLDGKENIILDMHANGYSMYAISKKLKVSAPTIKRFLITQNKKEPI